MPLSQRQFAAFADTYAWQVPYDTSPRHLAGPGDARHVTHGLAAAGWRADSDPLSAEIVLLSPDHRYRLQYDPQSSTSAWWRLRAEHTDGEPSWYAEFGKRVPAEILGALTDALVVPASPHADPWQAVTSADWHRDSDTTARSPDSMCLISLRPPSKFHDRPFWHVDTREPGYGELDGPRIWHAWFDSHVPDRLVAAFLTALTDPGPLQRGLYDRISHHSAVQTLSALRPQQVVDAHTARLKSLSAQVRAALHRTQTTPAALPAPARTDQPATRR